MYLIIYFDKILINLIIIKFLSFALICGVKSYIYIYPFVSIAEFCHVDYIYNYTYILYLFLFIERVKYSCSICGWDSAQALVFSYFDGDNYYVQQTAERFKHFIFTINKIYSAPKI